VCPVKISGVAGSVGARVLTVGLVAAAMTVVGTGAQAAPTGDDPAATGTSYSAGRYVVMLREPAAASYGGGNPRYAATRSTTGSFDARSARVAAYSSHLRRAQGDVAGQYGAKPVDSFTVAANGFVADLSAMKDWGLELDKRHILVDSAMRTNLPRVFAAGDITEYDGKVRLIAVGFGEVATAVNNAAPVVDPAAKVFPGHSSDNG